MILATLSFYFFAAIVLLSAVQVIFARNPVHSVLFLILAFFSSAGLFILQGAEFLAMVLVIVYVGAVAILFLFVVMMLNVGSLPLKEGLVRYGTIGAMVGGLLLAELILVVTNWGMSTSFTPAQPIPDPSQRTNTQALGDVLYTDYLLLFQTAGLILLVAMVGAIVLTLRKRSGVKRQDIAKQNLRTVDQSIEMKSVPSGSGGQGV